MSDRSNNVARSRKKAAAAAVPDGPVSPRCREGLHLWCPLKAGRFGKYPCGCECHSGHMDKVKGMGR
jgi:hypothetical protein